MKLDAEAKSSLQQYVAEVRSLWGDGKDPELPHKVKGLMEKLLTTASPQESWITKIISKGLPCAELYRDEEHGFIQLGHVRAKSYSNSPHDHGPCWVVYGIYHGAIEITTYQRSDNIRVADGLQLDKKELVRLTQGSAMPYRSGEIHSIFAAGPSVVLCFLSGDPEGVERYQYSVTA